MQLPIVATLLFSLLNLCYSTKTCHATCSRFVTLPWWETMQPVNFFYFFVKIILFTSGDNSLRFFYRLVSLCYSFEQLRQIGQMSSTRLWNVLQRRWRKETNRMLLQVRKNSVIFFSISAKKFPMHFDDSRSGEDLIDKPIGCAFVVHPRMVDHPRRRHSYKIYNRSYFQYH